MAGPYALMWSGGKDSALALARARAQGLPVSLLLNFHDLESGRVRFHATRVDLGGWALCRTVEGRGRCLQVTGNAP